MKKMEIIIPHRRLNDASEILKSANTGGMTHYKVAGRGITKAEAVAVGEVPLNIPPNLFRGPRLKL
jgi:nitrogen regulatory protein P-II 1